MKLFSFNWKKINIKANKYENSYNMDQYTKEIVQHILCEFAKVFIVYIKKKV